MEEPDYVRISGSPVGFAGPQGLRERLASFNGARLLADHAVAAIAGGVSGANKKDVHVKNLSHGRDFTVEAFGDFHVAAAGDICPRCQKSAFVFQKGIEVGHIFKLGVKYSKAFNASYLDTEGKPQLMVMGCYGIGVSRIVAAVIEQNHDEMGMIWPKAIAPMSVHLIGVEAFDEQVKSAAEALYQGFLNSGVDVLFDDRDERAGVKFKDADLIGIPVRVTVSKRTLAKGSVEIKTRNQKESKLVDSGVALESALKELATFNLT